MSAQHGSLTMYVNHGCRCEPCTIATRAHRARYAAANPRTTVPKAPRSEAWDTTVGRVVVDADPRWRDDAACRGIEPSLFFPVRGEDASAAKAVCALCPARDDCLAYALANGEKDGVWGGTSGRERRGMRKVAA